MNQTIISFGTDGWRGIIGKDFNNKTVAEAAQAFADYLHSISPNKIIKAAVAYDGRNQSKPSALLFSKVLSGNSIHVSFSDKLVPTPLLSYYVKEKNLDGGAMITASHNPHEYNGVKLKASNGGPFSPEEINKIEKYLGHEPVKSSEENITFEDFKQTYFDHLSEFIDFNAIKEAGIKLVIDSMGGACQQLVQNILSRYEIPCTTISKIAENDFGSRVPEPIEKNLIPLRSELIKGDYSFGFATDGDGDRLGVMTDEGHYISSQEIILLISDFIVNHRNYSGNIIKTYSVTDKVRFLFANEQRKVLDVPIGYKYVCRKMISHDAAFGCEESGGYSFRNHMPDRDGIASGLILAELLAKSGYNKLKELIMEKRKIWGEIYFKRKDFYFDFPEIKYKLNNLLKNPVEEIHGFKVISFHDFYNERKALNSLKYTLEGSNRWILIRSSGTEPLIRIFAEGESEEELNNLLKTGEALFKGEFI